MKQLVTLFLVLLLIAPSVSMAQDNDTVVLLWTSQPDSLFPDYAVTATAGYVMINLYSTLVTTDLQGNLVGDLATGWEVSEDQLTWTFTLRDDVLWHDGTPLTAADVKFSYEVASDPAYAGGYFYPDIAGAAEKQSGEAAEVSGVQVIDDYTVTITTVEPNALVLSNIAQRYILPSHLLADMPVADLASSAQSTAPVGTGPYRLVEWRVDEALVFEAFPEYYGGAAIIPNYIWKVVPDVATHYTELVTDAADVSTSVPADDFSGIQSEPGIATLQMPGINLTMVMFNTGSPFFSDVRTRQAMAYAVNRQSIIDVVGSGNGGLVTSQLHPSVPEYNADIVPYAYDPAQAGALLDEAGWRDEDGNGVRESYGIAGLDDGTAFSVELGTWSNPLYNLPAQIIQQNLKDVGVEVALNVVDFNVYFSEYLTTSNPNFQFGMSGWFNFSVPTYFDIAGNFPTDSGGYGRTLWSNARVDELVPTIPGIFEEEARKAVYDEIQTIVHAEVPVLYLTRLDNLVAHDSNLVIPEIANLRGLFKSIRQWSWAG